MFKWKKTELAGRNEKGDRLEKRKREKKVDRLKK
jgi:hypothetical protein